MIVIIYFGLFFKFTSFFPKQKSKNKIKTGDAEKAGQGGS